MSGVLTHIHVAGTRGGVMSPQSEATLVTGKGIEGDRNFGRERRRNVTLVEDANVADACATIGATYEAGCTRRNLTVTGIALNDLVDKEFTVGSVRLVGCELCEPCNQMETAVGPGALRALVHKAGIRAEILEGGVVRVGDAVHVADATKEAHS